VASFYVRRPARTRSPALAFFFLCRAVKTRESPERKRVTDSQAAAGSVLVPRLRSLLLACDTRRNLVRRNGSIRTLRRIVVASLLRG
jgi:hypothetical protein